MKSEIVTPISALKDTDIPGNFETLWRKFKVFIKISPTDSPISGNSQVSTRSSGDSYSSSSSTRQLLLSVPPDNQQDGQSKQVSDNNIDDETKTDKTNSSSLS